MLTLSHISKTFNPGTVNEKKALEDLSLHLDAGDFVTIIGANGAGKSTLFNAIGGSFFTDSGTIELGGEDITFLPEYRRAKNIGRLFQDPMSGSAPGMTIEENLALAAGHGGWFAQISKQDREMFREKLSLLGMGLEDRLRQPVGLLSGGQRQALTLMMATIVPPKLLPLTQKIVAENKLTCLMITHNMQSALELGNRTLMMDKGRIIQDVSGEKRKGLTIQDLLESFKAGVGKELDNDRMLLST